jgi:6,7-dimethyl-8-ribityllumazine synthase
MEIPLIARKLADTKKYAAIICLGCVIQGETDHYDYVCSQVVQGTSQVALTTGLPVIFGVLTCQTLEQALNRAGGKSGNKGFDAALAALEMVSLTQSILP